MGLANTLNRAVHGALLLVEWAEAPYKGDPGTSSVSVKEVDKNTMEETDQRDGKVIEVADMTVSADGKALTAKVDDKLHGTTSQFTAMNGDETVKRRPARAQFRGCDGEEAD